MAKPSTLNCKECGRVTIRVSWSQLRVHEECKQRGYLQRTGHRASLDNQRVFFPGTVTDRVVRDWLVNSPDANPGIMPDMVSSVIDREWKVIEEEGGTISWRNASDRAQVLADCREAVTKIEPTLMKYVVPFEYEADKRFSIPVQVPDPRGGTSEILLIGAMDIMVHDNKSRYMVHDVKHTRDNSYWRKTTGQLMFYDVAVELMTGQPTALSTLMQPLAQPEVKAFTFTAEDRAQIMQRIVSFAQDRIMDVRPPRDDVKYCGWCSVKHACTKFTPVVKDGKRRMSLI